MLNVLLILMNPKKHADMFASHKQIEKSKSKKIKRKRYCWYCYCMHCCSGCNRFPSCLLPRHKEDESINNINTSRFFNCYLRNSTISLNSQQTFFIFIFQKLLCLYFKLFFLRLVTKIALTNYFTINLHHIWSIMSIFLSMCYEIYFIILNILKGLSYNLK